MKITETPHPATLFVQPSVHQLTPPPTQQSRTREGASTATSRPPASPVQASTIPKSPLPFPRQRPNLTTNPVLPNSTPQPSTTSQPEPRGVSTGSSRQPPPQGQPTLDRPRTTHQPRPKKRKPQATPRAQQPKPPTSVDYPNQPTPPLRSPAQRPQPQRGDLLLARRRKPRENQIPRPHATLPRPRPLPLENSHPWLSTHHPPTSPQQKAPGKTQGTTNQASDLLLPVLSQQPAQPFQILLHARQ